MFIDNENNIVYNQIIPVWCDLFLEKIMKISSKGRYAVRIMAELARHGGEFVPVSELSEKQNITTKYLEKIISMLVKANFVQSSRGAQGGYKLTRKPEEYTVAEILKITDDLPKLVPCIAEHEECPMASKCDSIGVWGKLTAMIDDYLQKITIKDLIDKTY